MLQIIAAMDSAPFFEMKEGCKLFWVKNIVWLIVAKKGTNILIL